MRPSFIHRKRTYGLRRVCCRRTVGRSEGLAELSNTLERRCRMGFDFVLHMTEGFGAFVGFVNAHNDEIVKFAQLKFKTLFDESSSDVNEQINTCVRNRVAEDSVITYVLSEDCPSELLKKSDGRNGRLLPLPNDEGTALGRLQSTDKLRRQNRFGGENRRSCTVIYSREFFSAESEKGFVERDVNMDRTATMGLSGLQSATAKMAECGSGSIVGNVPALSVREEGIGLWECLSIKLSDPFSGTVSRDED